MLCAQDCATGYCPSSLIVHHKAGQVSPETVDITYTVIQSSITGTAACWIAQNLGAPTYTTTLTDNAATTTTGWYWQFGQQKGLRAVSHVIVNTSDIVSDFTAQTTDWATANDPCNLLLGGAWRIPTRTEWNAILSAWSYNLSNNGLHLIQGGHYGGSTFYDSPYCGYWTNTRSGTNTAYTYQVSYTASAASVPSIGMSWASTLRCIRAL